MSRDEELEQVLDEYDPEELRLVALDGFTIYHDEGDDNIGDEMLWKWDSEYDGAPYGTLETLFAREGLEPEY